MVKQCDLPKNCYPGENFLQFHLRPIKQQGFDRSDIPNALDKNSILLETKTLLEEKPLATGVCVDENTHDRLERKSFGSVRPLSTSTSAVSKDALPLFCFYDCELITIQQKGHKRGANACTSEKSGIEWRNRNS